MKDLFATVSKESFYFKDVNGHFVIDFTIQVDSIEYIFGELLVNYICDKAEEFRVGDRLKIDGKILKSFGFILEATSIKRLPIFY